MAPGQCGHCVPCLIRRAAIKKAFGSDPTKYVALPDLQDAALDTRTAVGEHVRSFQVMNARLRRAPSLARIIVRKPGPLSDYGDDEVRRYAGVFRRGIFEVGEALSTVDARPL